MHPSQTTLPISSLRWFQHTAPQLKRLVSNNLLSVPNPKSLQFYRHNHIMSANVSFITRERKGSSSTINCARTYHERHAFPQYINKDTEEYGSADPDHFPWPA